MAKKILLADDSITIQKVVELTFSDGDYEVIAVNNGAKAIQKLSEMRPDIILSDIIMPEKNGYEVCEFVKSRPDLRNIPVVLLTGTFEPFDPDRADKAGCDAVVTKPFESQSLIHKVEELIQQSRTAASAPAAAPLEPEPASPWTEEKSGFTPAPEPSFIPAPAFSSAPAFTPAPEPPAFQSHDTDVFSAAPAAHPVSPAEMPFDTPAPGAFSGETSAFPRMSFDELQRTAAPPAPAPMAPPPAATPEPSPWDEQQPPSAAAPPPAVEPSPWDEQQPAFAGETRAFPAMSFEDLKRPTDTSPPPAPEPAPPAMPEPSPWDEPQSATGGETRAFPRLAFDELQQAAATPSAPAPEPPKPAAPPESSPWDEQPEFGGETRALPRMTFDDLQRMAASVPPVQAPRADSSLWDEPAASATPPSWASAEPPAAPESPRFPAAMPSAFAEPPRHDEMPFGEDVPAAASAESAPAAPPPKALEHEAASPAASATSAIELTEEQIDRIARRVVQLISNDVVKNIAWEVIPDMAEMVVKERIRQLETES